MYNFTKKGLKINKVLYILGTIFLVFLFMSVFIPNPSLVGVLGETIGNGCFNFFGYLGYLIPFYLGIILYLLYKQKLKEFFEKLFGGFIVYINMLILQSMIFGIGDFGNIFLSVVKPYIGNFGLVLLVITIFLLVGLILKIDILKLKFLNKTEKMDSEIIEENDITSQPIQKPVEKIKDKTQIIEEYIQNKLKEVHTIDEDLKVKNREELKDKQTQDQSLSNIETLPNREENDEVKPEKEETSIETNKTETISNEIIEEEILSPQILEKSKDEDSQNDKSFEEDLSNEENQKTKIVSETIEIEEVLVETEKEEFKIEEVKDSIQEDISNNNISNENILTEKQLPKKPHIPQFTQKISQPQPQQEFTIKEITEPEQQKENQETDLSIQKSIIVSELDENKELLKDVEIGEVDKPNDFELPSLEFLTKPKDINHQVNEEEIDTKVQLLLNKLRNFKIDGDVVRTYTGPVVTTFEFKPLAHIKVSKILNLQDDLAMALRAETIRIQAPIPGKDVVGIEIPNEEIETIYLREILEDEIFKNAKSPLVIALGKDIVGNPFVTDLAKLPHVLIAGTTGSGKSVGINSMILSLLYRNSPDDLKLMMIDPKMLEFSIYNDIPHLLTPVITDPKKAIAGLSSMVKEMERRYKLMSEGKVKNIVNYNEKFPENKMPYIVVIIDELADLMMTGGKDVEYSIARLAQMARASGIHLIVATQRPSVDVVTGLIKANLPSRMSFKVGQKIDSKVVLDQYGAESLLGRGDMLFTPPGSSALVRLHAPFTTEEEIEKIVEFLKSQRSVDYDENFLFESVDGDGVEIDDKDELFEEAKEIILKEQKTSISYLQRRLQIGYNRAANIIEQLELSGFLSAPNSKGQREIL